MSIIRLHDKEFKPHILQSEIDVAISRVAANLNSDYKGKKPFFVGVLNGSFLFVADLLRKIELECEVSFVKLTSYEGTTTTGQVKELVGLNENIEGREVILLEDIVDTGITLESLYQSLEGLGASSIKVATLLFKPNAYTKSYPIDYAALEVGNEFLVGYGLDYDGLGRNLKDIYIITED